MEKASTQLDCYGNQINRSLESHQRKNWFYSMSMSVEFKQLLLVASRLEGKQIVLGYYFPPVFESSPLTLTKDQVGSG